MRLPTVKTIETRLQIDNEKARIVRSILEDYREGRTCNARMALHRVDEVIGGHGVEDIQSKQDTMHYFYGLEYVNMGDPYRCTVLYDHGKERWDVACWGDYVEAYDYRFGE